jgi:hypothetical protein
LPGLSGFHLLGIHPIFPDSNMISIRQGHLPKQLDGFAKQWYKFNT